MDHALVTTAFTLDGYRIVKTLGLVRGITVRSRSILGNIGAGIQTLFGGNITLYQELCERARQEAYEIMIYHGEQIGANGIIAVTPIRTFSASVTDANTPLRVDSHCMGPKLTRGRPAGPVAPLTHGNLSGGAPSRPPERGSRRRPGAGTGPCPGARSAGLARATPLARRRRPAETAPFLPRSPPC